MPNLKSITVEVGIKRTANYQSVEVKQAITFELKEGENHTVVTNKVRDMLTKEVDAAASETLKNVLSTTKTN